MPEPRPPRRDVEVLFVRHGETVHNRERRMSGHRDAPLTLAGLHQAEGVGRLLAARYGGDLGRWRWMTSPLFRAWQTAVVVADVVGVASGELVHDPRLKEMTWGRWDGLTAAEIEARDPELWRARIDDRWTVPPPGGGETQRDIITRAEDWLAELASHARVVAFGHGALGRALRCAYRGLPDAAMLEMDEPQGSVFRLARGDEERLDPSG
ncbi:MAG: histidine phosphatase family protein [Alphaproteobacteria bacterium]|nr:histidine phosphatase family protein [Alphaproteobacteria bacterium]